MDSAVDTSRWTEVRDRIRSVLREEDRDPSSLEIVAVTKGFPASIVERAHEGGFKDVGENRVGEALDKKRSLAADVVDSIRWHFIGHLQSNKVRKILGEFDLIHGVDRMSLIDELDKRLSREDLKQDVLMQVNVSGEESKHGVLPEEAVDLAGEITDRNPLNLRGLMTIAPWVDDESVLHSTFRECRQLRDSIEDQLGITCPELSMGMTNDYTVAIREGATIVRLGRALFGERPE